MKQVLNTTEVAWLLRIDPRNVRRHLRKRGVEPLAPVRIGRSWVTRWSAEQISAVAPGPGGQ